MTSEQALLKGSRRNRRFCGIGVVPHVLLLLVLLMVSAVTFAEISRINRRLEALESWDGGRLFEYADDGEYYSMEPTVEETSEEVPSRRKRYVPVIEESYAERKMRNLSRMDNYRALRRMMGGKPSSPAYKSFKWDDDYYYSLRPSTEAPMYLRKSRVQETDTGKRPPNRVPNVDRAYAARSNYQTPLPQDRIFPVRRNYIGLPAVIQYSGDSTKYDNTRDSVFVNWLAETWAQSLGLERLFGMHGGVLTIQHGGLYLVYAQVYFDEGSEGGGFQILRNGLPVLHCERPASSQPSGATSCFTQGLVRLAPHDTLALSETNRAKTQLQPGKSFFGLIKITDLD